MNKIKFENLLSKKTPLSAEIFNIMQDNIEEAIDEAVGKFIESGSNSNGGYIKFSDGTMICTKRKVFGSTPIRNTWGSFYESAKLDLGDYAQPFIIEPKTFVMPVNTFFIERDSNSSATSFGSFYAVRPVAADIYVTVDCLAIGKWK